MVESLLLTACRLITFIGGMPLTNASGFFFEVYGKLFLVTSRHVVLDEATEHFPDRIEIMLHVDEENLAVSTGFSIPLYRDGKSIWHDGRDSGGSVDIAAIEIERDALPDTAVFRAFSADHIVAPPEPVEIGSTLLVVGFPLGFQDTLHNMPVVRQAVVASSFGLRFQGKGYFLTDARTHRGSSGAPVAMRAPQGKSGLGDLPWRLLGVHSSRLDMGSRDHEADEALGLNCTWYADMLTTLTAR